MTFEELAKKLNKPESWLRFIMTVKEKKLSIWRRLINFIWRKKCHFVGLLFY